jgi:hypothetical protein
MAAEKKTTLLLKGENGIMRKKYAQLSKVGVRCLNVVPPHYCVSVPSARTPDFCDFVVSLSDRCSHDFFCAAPTHCVFVSGFRGRPLPTTRTKSSC